MSRSKMRSRSEWTRLANEMISCGMTQKAWCEAYGINVSSMRKSIKRIEKSKEQITSDTEMKTPENWIEAICADSKDMVSHAVPSIIEVMAGRYVIKVPSGFDRVTFIDICKALTSL